MEAQESLTAEQTPPPTRLGKNNRILGDKNVASTHAVTVLMWGHGSWFRFRPVRVVHDGTHCWCCSVYLLAGSRKNRTSDSDPDRAGGRDLAQGRRVECSKVWRVAIGAKPTPPTGQMGLDSCWKKQIRAFFKSQSDDGCQSDLVQVVLTRYGWR